MKSQLFRLNDDEKSLFAQRRKSLMKSLPEGVALISSGHHCTRSHDTEFPFRPQSNFFYLTGHNAPACLLLLDTRNHSSCLFVPKRQVEMELWTGEMLGPERVQEFLGIEESRAIDSVEEELGQRLKNAKHVMLDLHAPEQVVGDASIDRALACIKKLAYARKPNFHAPGALVHLPPFIEKMRLIKSQQDIEWLQRSNDIAQTAHRLAMRSARPGMHEYQLQAQIEWAFKFLGAPSPAYESIVAGGDRANTLHYIANRHLLVEGELVLIDAGCEWMHMASDITRTFPVNGRFSAPQKEIYQLVLNAQHQVLESAKIGSSLTECHQTACRALTQGLLDIGILKGALSSLIEQEAWKAYYPHGTSHWLGLDVHDQCPYKDEHLKDLSLTAGMCFTIEPGLYFAEQNTSVPKQYRGIGVRIEDDVVVTNKGLLNLTQGLPKTVAAIEEECRRDPFELMKEIWHV